MARARTRFAIATAFVVALVAVQLLSAFIFSRENATIWASMEDLPTSSGSGTGKNKINATINGMGLRFVPRPKSSNVHCVGDNFLPKTSSGYRSCQFRHLCWDNTEKEFVIFESEEQKKIAQLLQDMPSRYARISSSFNTSVSTSPTSESRLRRGKDGLWYPRTIPVDNQGYYEFPEDVVLVPVDFPLDGTVAQTEIMFDYFHPIYNLLSMFGLQDMNTVLVNVGADCVVDQECYTGALGFLPIMKRKLNAKGSFISRKDLFEWTPDVGQQQPPNRICARYGTSGIGGLTDHGIHKKSHGERRKDYTFVQNSGRGPLFFDFRNYVLKNLGVSEEPESSNSYSPTRATISISASKRSGTQDFQKQTSAIQNYFPSEKLEVQKLIMSQLSITERFRVASKTSFYISMMGDGALPAFFLPRGATLILFYNDNDEFVSVSKQEVSFPAKIDWDLWNNLSHLRVHWLPLSTMNEEADINLLLRLIENDFRTVNPSSFPPKKRKPDGTLNGIDVYYMNHSQTSNSHCLGSNFQERSHALVSCEFRFMCLDLSVQPTNFTLVASDDQSNLLKSLKMQEGSFASTSTTMNWKVSVGHNIRFEEKSDWFPEVINGPIQNFYELPPEVVWIPFFADQPNIHNPGHLLWDYFLPFFNLLMMFGLEKQKLLISNIDEGCVQEEDTPCWKMVTKFLPLLSVEPYTFRNTRNLDLKIRDGNRRSSIVCARQGVAGTGMLTDHGYNRHGQRFEDYRDVHNVGRGPLFFSFRNYMIQNMGMNEDPPGVQRPYPIIFSMNSSKNPARRRDFQNHAAALGKSFTEDEIAIKRCTLAELSLEEQVRLATESAVFVSVVGGAASIATFLPRGSSVILFFNDIDDFTDHSPRKDFPSMIDWDFWNNASYLRVHWLPMRTMDQSLDLEAFTELVRSELSSLESMS